MNINKMSMLVILFVFLSSQTGMKPLAQSTIDPINELKVSPDGVYTAVSYSNGGVVLLNNQDQSEVVLRSSATRISAVMVFSWHPSEAWLAGGDNRGDILIWDVTTTELITTLHNTGGVVSLDWFSDGYRLLASYGEVAAGGGAIIWNTTTSQKVLETVTLSSNSADLHPNEHMFIMSSGQSITFWDVFTGENIFTIPTETFDHNLTWSPNGHVFAVWSVSSIGNSFYTYVSIRDGSSGNIINNLNVTDLDTSKIEGGVSELGWSLNGDMLYVSTLFGRMHFWDTKTGHLISTINYDGWISGLDILPDGSQFVFGGLPNNNQPATVQYAAIPQFPTEESSGFATVLEETAVPIILDVSWSPDGEMLASIDNSGKLEITFADQTATVFEFTRTVPDLVKAAVSWSPQGKYLVAGMGNRIYIWDAASWQLLYDYEVGAPSGFSLIRTLETTTQREFRTSRGA